MQRRHELRSHLCRCLYLWACLAMGCGWTSASATPLWGSYGGAGCDGKAKAQAFEKLVGATAPLVIDFMASDTWPSMLSSLQWILDCRKDEKDRVLSIAVPMWPKASSQGLQEVIAGEHDEHFQAFARLLVEHGRANAIVRLGWEFNGGWYPWHAKAREAQWQQAWRHIVRVMREVPGQAFRLDWCYSMSDSESYPVERAYPGDDVVDIVSADIYNQSWRQDLTTPQQRWSAFVHAPRGLNWLTQFATLHQKPIGVPEWGTGTRPDGHGGGDDPAFVRNMLAWIKVQPVAYQAYWNYPAGDYNALVTNGQYPETAQVLRQVFLP